MLTTIIIILLLFAIYAYQSGLTLEDIKEGFFVSLKAVSFLIAGVIIWKVVARLVKGKEQANPKSAPVQAPKTAAAPEPRDEYCEIDDCEVDDFDEDLYPELSDIDKPKRKSKGYSIDEMVEMDAIFDDDF